MRSLLKAILATCFGIVWANCTAFRSPWYATAIVGIIVGVLICASVDTYFEVKR